MRDNFLTIPDAPNYEINSQLICRNKFTKQILTLQHYDGKSYYSLRPHGRKHTLKGNPKTLRRQAVAATQNDYFEPIPSLDYRYEIDRRGRVRNVHSKQIMVVRNGSVHTHLKGKYIVRAIKDLLWEVHGKILERRFKPIPVTIENDFGLWNFDNIKACARFLAEKFFYTTSHISHKLYKRPSEIFGYKVTYRDNDFYFSDHALKGVQ